MSQDKSTPDADQAPQTPPASTAPVKTPPNAANTPKLSAPPRPPRNAPAAASRSGGAGLWLAVLDLLAIVAVAGGGYLALQNFENQRFSQQQRIDALHQTVNQLDVTRQGREQWFADTDERARSAAHDISELQRKRALADEHQEKTDKSVAQLAVQVQGGQNAWQRAEIEHLLLVANTRLQLQRDVNGAQIALRLANERLASLANPAYFSVREQISRELVALDAVPQIDLQALALQLAALMDQVESLTVRIPKAGQFETHIDISGGAPEALWYRRLWVSVQEAVNGLVSVRRDVDKREPLLAPDQTTYLQQNLRLQLESARIAALRTDPANFAAALRQAQTWLQRYFDTQQAGTAAALQSIERLQAVPLKPALPDISGSLNSLRTTEVGV